METKILEHECMTCGKVYWGEDKPHFCPHCNGSMVRVVETSDDTLGELMDDIENAGSERALASEWGTGSAQSDGQRAKAALREYVDAAIAAGVSEFSMALLLVIAAKEQVIEAKQVRIDELESDLRELQK